MEMRGKEIYSTLCLTDKKQKLMLRENKLI